MFMFMHSAAAQLAAKLAPRPSEYMPVELADTTQPYDPQLCEGLIMRLHASKAQNRTVFSHVRVAGRDVLSQFHAMSFSGSSGKSVYHLFPNRKCKKALDQGNAEPRPAASRYLREL